MRAPLCLVITSFTVLTLAPEALARAGGGRNSGGGGLIALILAPLFIIFAWYVNRRINTKSKEADALLERLAKKDPVWDEKKLEDMVGKSFFAIESAWCSQNLNKLSLHLTPELAAQWATQIACLKQSGQWNKMDDLKLDTVRIVEVKNYREKEKDSFTACLDAGAVDYTVDAEGQVFDSNAGSRRGRDNNEKEFAKFREFWTFQRHGDKWLLSAVDQKDAWEKLVDEPLVDEK